MKVVIIGGGIAGLTLGIFLRKKNIDAVIFERSEDVGNRGHGFLMHTDGLAILQDLAGTSKQYLPGKFISDFSLRRPSGEEVRRLELESWCCIKRVDLIHFLYSLLPDEQVRHAAAFSHFIYENEKIVAAEFIDGHREYGDLFVGADGKNSRVRELVFGPVDFTPVRVKEVVGICPAAPAATNTFIKFQSNEVGLALGLIPVSDHEQVWFMQYDSHKGDVFDSTPEELEVFCKRMLKNFPDEVQNVLKTNKFATSYIWNTCDFDLLPSFHHQNVVLIGDAAHVALPFTSAGTTNAIVDAKVLSECLDSLLDHEVAFNQYYQQRADDLAMHVNLGRELKSHFLFPKDHTDEALPVPLIANKKPRSAPAQGKDIAITYFTDPICSTCWVLQPLIRRLELEFGDYFDITYHMGGMLESWQHYQKGRIKNPLDAATHWEEVALQHSMPLDGDVWIEDPLNSSYPPSIAFMAAQMQDTAKARHFLRRLQEMVFVEKKNIARKEHLREAAMLVGLDPERLILDYESAARDRFKEDLKLAEDLGVTTFPTLYFTNKRGNKVVLKGFHSYERFEEVIMRLVPGAQRRQVKHTPDQLFALFAAMTTREFAFLSGIDIDTAEASLVSMADVGKLIPYKSKNGMLWKSFV
jgi:2-polyprenyl-6-methoxyphenol hydroxylase-like FAD-dependent oxidoreductase/predicted DsbA family dithiol-disulfide isomerase